MATTALSVRMDSPEFAALPSDERANVIVLEAVMKEIDAAANKMAVCKAWALRNGHRRGWSADRLRAKYYGWVASGRAWTFLVNWANVPKVICDERIGHVQALKRYAEDNQRISAAGFRAFMTDLRRGKYIEGVGTWKDLWAKENQGMRIPERCPSDWRPQGFNKRSMYRKGKLTPFEAKASREGMAAARQFIPSVFSTRVGLEPGRIYQFDDVWHDVMIAVPGVNRKLVRPLEFCCIDVASTCKVAYGLKPQIRREDGTREGLCKDHFKALIAHILTNVGWHRDGCVFVIEHGTASLTPTEQEIITRLTDGMITFRTSEILGKPVHAGLFTGKGHGNFKAKALVEASHRLIHYEAANLPAQTGGLSRVDAPEQLYGLQAYADKVLAIYEHLPADQREQLWYGGAMTMVSYSALVKQLYAAIYDRHDHNIEGWEQNEWMQMLWSVNGRDNWMASRDIPKLPAPMQEPARMALRTPGLFKSQRLSPAEVLDRYADRRVRLPPWAIIDFLGEDCYRTVRLDNQGLLTFQDKDLTGFPCKLRFAGTVMQPDGSRASLVPGTEYGLYVIPHDMSKAVVVDAGNRVVLGIAPQWSAVSPLNPDEVKVMVEAQARVIAAQSEPIALRHADQIEEFQHNKATTDLLLADLTELRKPAKRQRKSNNNNAIGNAVRALASTRVAVTTEGTGDDQW